MNIPLWLGFRIIPFCLNSTLVIMTIALALSLVFVRGFCHVSIVMCWSLLLVVLVMFVIKVKVKVQGKKRITIMKTLDLYHFLKQIEKTHCTHYLILERNDSFVAVLGVPVRYGLLACFKTRPSTTLEHKKAIVEACRKNGIFHGQYETVYSY